MDEFKTGMRVVHPLFGAGTIRSISGAGADAKISVDFSRNVGSKKLIASIAKLRSLETEDDDEQRRIWGAARMPAAALAPVVSWYETVELDSAPKSGRYPPREKLYEVIRAGTARHEFWSSIRERMRGLGLGPRVLDNPSGSVSVSVIGLMQVRVVVKHDEMVERAHAKMARLIVDSIVQRYLGDFDIKSIKEDFGISGALAELDIVMVPTEEIESLPDRAPLRRPLSVQDPGTIINRPRRRDDY